MGTDLYREPSPADPAERYRSLPPRVRPEDLVELVDTRPPPAEDVSDERDILLRTAAG